MYVAMMLAMDSDLEPANQLLNLTQAGVVSAFAPPRGPLPNVQIHVAYHVAVEAHEPREFEMRLRLVAPDGNDVLDPDPDVERLAGPGFATATRNSGLFLRLDPGHYDLRLEIDGVLKATCLIIVADPALNPSMN